MPDVLPVACDRTRFSFWSAAALAVLVAAGGCADTPPPKPVPEVPATFTLAHVPGARLRMDDPEGLEAFEEAAGPLTTLAGLRVALFGPNAIANESEQDARDALDILSSVAGILVTRSLVVPGERELGGALAGEEVVRLLAAAKLLPGLGGSYAVKVAPATRLCVLAGPGGAAFLRRVLAQASEPRLIVALARVPTAGPLWSLLRSEARVKLVVAAGKTASVEAAPGGLVVVRTPGTKLRVVSIEPAALRTWLLSPDSATPPQIETFPLR